MTRLPRIPLWVLSTLVLGCVTTSQDSGLTIDATVIDLPESAHFQTKEGADHIIGAGPYRVNGDGSDGLTLQELEGTGAVMLKAEAVTHDFELRGPIALAVPEGDDRRHIVLMMPGGQALNAIGSLSGVSSRATVSTTVSRMTMLQAAQVMPQSQLAQMVMAPPDACAGAIPPPPTPPQIATLSAPTQTTMRTSRLPSKSEAVRHMSSQEFGSDPIPDVVDWQPKQKVPAGRELIIQGRNLDPTKFVAKIGETVLPAASQSSSQIRLAIPSWLRTFNTPLVVYHRGGTPRTLEINYEVFDPAVRITRVAPDTFSQGDLVTLCGVSVSHLSLIENVRTNPGGGTPIGEMRKLGLIGQPNGQYQHYHWVEMLNPVASASSDRLTFVAGPLYKSVFRQADASGTGAYTDIIGDSTPPSPITGPLSFRSETNPTTSRDVLAPNTVTWRLGGPKIVKLGVNPHASGFFSNESFVILPAVLPNNTTFPRLAQLLVEGYNLSGQYTIANIPLSGGFRGAGLPSDDTKGLLSVPSNATGGQVCGTKNSITNCWPQPFGVVPGPVLASLPWQLPAPASLPASYDLQSPRWPLALRTTYTINGLYLQPTGVPGLTYTLELPGLMNPSQQIAGGSAPTFDQCNMVFSVLEHTASRIQFRIGDPAKPLPSSGCMAHLQNWYFNQGAQGGPILRLTARYAGQQSELAYFRVYFTQ